tara:strand:+ start:386 stop:547 length:162 start_codon:yes stop_codon:yes gene_type:complete
MPKYRIMSIETLKHFYTIEASSIEHAQEIYQAYPADNTYPQSEDIEDVKEVST